MASEMNNRNKSGELTDNSRWLQEQMNPYFFVAMQDEPEAIDLLNRELGSLRHNRRLLLADREKSLIMARVNQPGSLYDTLRRIVEREISYAMISHSDQPIPGLDQVLEIQRFEFDRKKNEEITVDGVVNIPPVIRRKVRSELKMNHPEFDQKQLDRLLRIIWLNNENYVRTSSPSRIAQVLNIFQKGNQSGGLYLDMEVLDEGRESRVHFAVGNPPQKDFLLQIMEVFNRLDIGVNRAYCLTISNGVHPYFLGTFFVRRRDGCKLELGSDLYNRLQIELYNTQILATSSHTYREFVIHGIITGEEATLVNAFIAFCYTNLAHNQPDRFGLDDVSHAFHAHPEIALLLVNLFRIRLAPCVAERQERYVSVLAETTRIIEEYNTGHRHLDEIRRDIFRCALLFIRHTLKSNAFVLEKQALSFRLDPAYLADLGAAFTSDLPQADPFRITFFFSRFGYGYHIGFSDIARGGWRTVICRSEDDLVTNANSLFRENFVLAHTQHLKNKDIYEGGSKLVVILDASDLSAQEREIETLRLYKLQYGIANAFLDIYVTDNGVARHPSVLDYYREEEPIELGPDENMHDSMVETIAKMSQKRGYLLGIGIISSKKVGINHKDYGVTSVGVVKFAEITMQELGIDMHRDPFSVKFTGGPNGDVAGNAMRIILDRCPLVSIRLILDGTAALYDPQGASHGALQDILLKQDLHAFDVNVLHPGGMMLFRTGRRAEGLRELYRKVSMTEDGLLEEWITSDELSRLFNDLVFTVPADLFIPGGGRPETIDKDNWERFILPDGIPSARVIVEGANSFITPYARIQLQKKGVLIMRDASANKCGVISSSYEIIANLLFSEQEFLEQKERYVRDVLHILETVSEWEARLILNRRRENPALLCTDISDAISSDINGHYTRLFKFFQDHPDLCLQPFYRRAIIGHLPHMVQCEAAYRRRITRLPQKYLFAILAAEIGSSMVYRGNHETAFEDEVRLHINRKYPPRALLPLNA
jgi:glutamate dehydrogenase